MPALNSSSEEIFLCSGVTFVTLHITGSNNGLGRAPDGDAEHAERNKANLAWLQHCFETAKASNSRAIMILQQANIFPAHQPTAGRDLIGFENWRDLREFPTGGGDEVIE